MLRRLGIAVAAIVGVVLLAVLGVLGYAQTGTGQAQLAALLTRQLSTPEQQVELAGLSGFVPFDMGLANLRLRDALGVWLEVDDARLEVVVPALLKGEIAVKQMGARRVALHRLPPPAPPPQPEPPFSLPKLPELPGSLPRIDVERLFVDTLELDQPVLGETATFALGGNATTGAEGRQARVELSLRRTDQPTAELALTAGLDLAAQSLSIDLTGSETGGLLAAASGRPEAGALRLSLEGQGPLSGWQGRLAVDAERLAKLDLAVDLAYAEQKLLTVTGALDAASDALPVALAEVIGTHAELGLRAGETAPGRYALDDLRLQVASLSLQGAGSADLPADTVQGTLRLDAPDLARFNGLAQTELAGAASLQISASGAAAQPDLKLALDGSNLRATSIAVARLTSAFDVAFTTPLGQGPVGIRANGTAAAEGLTLEGRDLGDGGRLTLALDGELPAKGEATLRDLTLRSSLGELTGHARIDRDRLAGTARLDATVPELAAVLQISAAPSQLAGAVHVGADIVLGERAERIDVTLDGAGTDLRGLPAGAQELVGSAPTLRARAVIEPARVATFESLIATGEGFSLEGNPSLGLSDRALGGELRLSMPDLGRLQPLVGQPMAGGLQARAGLAGTADNPAVTIDGKTGPVVLAGLPFDLVTLAGDAKGPLDALGGSARLTMTRASQQLALATGYQLAGQQLKLTGIRLDGPATQLGGDADIALDGPLVRGQLAGEARNLSALEGWIGQKLAGNAKLDLRLATPDRRQDASLRVDASGLAGDFGAMQSASLDAKVTDALGRGAIDATLRAAHLATPAVTVDQAAIGVGGRLAALDVTAAANGSQGGQPFDLAAAAGLDVLGQRKTIRLTKLTGTLAGEPLRLAQPATVVVDRATVGIDALDLALGPARVQGSLDLGDPRVRGQLTLAELPLAVLQRFGGPALAGTARANLDLAGSRRAPQLTLDVVAQKVALDKASRVTTNGTLKTTLQDGRVESTVELTGLGAAPLTARIALPASFGLDPPAFALNDGASLTGSLAGPIDLARVAQLAALDGVQLAGILQLALDLGGTLAQPRLDGTAALAKGSVQELVSGINLRDLTLRARASGARLAIEELSASDRAGGKLTGGGGLSVPPGGGLDFDVTLDAATARVMDNPLGVVVLSGNLGLAGDLTRAFVKGALTVDRADIEIPDAGGPSVPVMEVTEVNGRTAAPAAKESNAVPFDLGFDLALDIPGRLFVRGRGLDSEWEGALRLKGDLVEQQVLGSVKTKRGFFDLLDRRFTIERGEVVFVGSKPPLPMIDLAATAKTVDVSVTVDLKGPAADPKLTLSSDPNLPQDEILSRLLFGTGTARITPVQGLRLAAAIQQLQGGSFVGDVLSTVRKTTGLDTLDVQGGETDTESTARAGKYLSDNVYVEVERGVSEGTGKARVQVELTPNLSVGTSVNDQSQSGVGLQWKYDY